ncbi:MAG: M28 family peptidase [Candidatus Thorarchaeota archaeon]|nr:MAG: M28 family peptidase [Candidatus Thorarchaeota archaeon]
MRLTWLVLLLLFIPHGSVEALQTSHVPVFDGTNAMLHLNQQCQFGPRPPGSDNLTLCREYFTGILESFGWTVIEQNFTYLGVECVNLIARYGAADNATIVLAAHYDTRPLADQDPDPANRTRPLLGANDGASGSAVLLELSRVLPVSVRSAVEIVFFDAEDSGGISGWDWIVGSTYYVSQLNTTRREAIAAMILFDMVGDKDARFLRERGSTRSLQDTVWFLAADMGHDDIFIDTLGGSILDDHRPFLDVDIPALDIIQHNPLPSYWHTVEDTPDKCSSISLQAVGEVAETFVVSGLANDGTFVPNPPDFLYIALLVALPIIVVAVLILTKRR